LSDENIIIIIIVISAQIVSNGALWSF